MNPTKVVRPQISALECRRISDAADAVRVAKRSLDGDAVHDAECALRHEVQAVSDRGISWQVIGECLGIRRGNAYQRFRHTPQHDAPSLRRAQSPTRG